MSEKEKTNKEEIKNEADKNLVGFFALLFEIDSKKNPELYKLNSEEKND